MSRHHFSAYRPASANLANFYRFPISPTALDFINRENARHELNLVARNLEHNGPREEGGVLENALSKRHRVGDWSGDGEFDSLAVCVRRDARKSDLHIRDSQSWLTDQQDRMTASDCEVHRPRPLVAAPMLDPIEEREIAQDAQRADQQQWLPNTFTLHG